MLLAYSARRRSRGIVERSQLGEYSIGVFLAGYVPPEVTNLTLHLPWMRRGGDQSEICSAIEKSSTRQRSPFSAE
jgi:hypothetical protein